MKTPKSIMYALKFQCDDESKTNKFYESIGVDIEASELAVFMSGKGDYATSSPVILMVQCEDVELISESLKDSGVTVLEPPTFSLWGLTMLIADPDGRPVLLGEGADKISARWDDYLARERTRK